MRRVPFLGVLVVFACGVCLAAGPQAPAQGQELKPPGQLAAEKGFPLNGVVGDLGKNKLKWEQSWHQDVSEQLSPLAEAAYRASATLDRKLVVDHFQSNDFDSDNPGARMNLDIGRHEFMKWACAEAMRRANQHMKETGQKPVGSIVIYNSSEVKDFSRDADLTAYAEDEHSEQVFFESLQKVFAEKRNGYEHGLEIKPRGRDGAYGRGFSLESMEVTFHRGTNEPPNVHAPMDLMEFSIAYRRGVERQAENPEAYIGFGFEQEVQARRTMQLAVKNPALLAQTFATDATGKVTYKGQHVTNPTEALNILRTTFGPKFSAAHNAMHVFCDFFQASHHAANPDEQIDKGPLKYSARATDALCRLFGDDTNEVYLARVKAIVDAHDEKHKDEKNPPPPPSPSIWSVMTEDEKVALLKRVLWRGHDADDQYDKRMRRIAAVLSVDPKSRKGVIGQDSDSQMAMIVMRRLAAESLRTVAQQMMCPDAVRPDGFPAEEWEKMSPVARMQHNIEEAKKQTEEFRKKATADKRKLTDQARELAAYEDKLSVAAMENMLIAMRLLHQIDLDIDTLRESPAKQNVTHWGTNAMDQIIAESSPAMQKVLTMASEHGKLAALMAWPKPAGMSDDHWAIVRRGWVQRMEQLRFEISGECYAFRDNKQRAKISSMTGLPPDDFVKKHCGPGMAADADLAECLKLERKYTAISLGGEDAPGLPGALLMAGAFKIGQLTYETITDPSNMPDMLTLVEMYQGNASNKDYAKFLLSTALSRYSDLLGYEWQITEISAIGDDAAREKAWTELAKGVVFHGLSYLVPAAGEAKLFFDIEKGVVMVTFGYAVNTLNNGVIDALYSGDAGRDPDLKGSISLKGDLRSSIEPVVPAEFFYVPKDQKKAVVNVVDFYKYLWKKFAQLDPEDDYRPPIGQKKRSELVHAHDDYLKLFADRAKSLEPTWFNSAQSVAEHISSPSLLFNESELEQRMRRLMDALEPYAQEEVDRVLNSEVGSTVQPYVQEVNGKKIDVIAEGMKNRLKMDFIAGAQSYWQSRMLMQLQARQMLEGLAVTADVNGLAEEFAKGDRILSKGQPMPKFGICILGPVSGEDSLKWEFDGRRKLPLRVGLKPLGNLPDDVPGISRELDFGPVQKVPAGYRPFRNHAAGVFDYAAAAKDPSLWSEQVYTQQVTARAKNTKTGEVLAECTNSIFVRLSPAGLEFGKSTYEAKTEEAISFSLIPKTMPPDTHKLPRYTVDFGDGQAGETLLVSTLEHAYEHAGDYTVTAKYYGVGMENQPQILLGEATCKAVVQARKLITVTCQNVSGKKLGDLESFRDYIGYNQTMNVTYTYEEGFPDRPVGKFRVSYTDGGTRAEGGYAKGQLDGMLNEYFNNGKPIKQIPYKKGTPVGKATTWYFSGKVAFESETDATGDAKWSKAYNEDGSLKSSWVYSGKRDGHYREYFGDGKVSMEYDMKDGYVVRGSTKCYDSKGNVTSTD